MLKTLENHKLIQKYIDQKSATLAGQKDLNTKVIREKHHMLIKIIY